MTFLVQARLVNSLFGDPGVFVDFRFGRRALLFDLGDLGALSSREIMRVSHAFVSHTHMDHFAGFDRLLRLCLHRTAPLHLLGPAGFIDRVEHRLASYTWNLLDAASVDFSLRASEFVGDRLARAAEFRAREAFRRREMAAPSHPPGLVLAEDEFAIDAAVLDHGTPSLAFALRERMRVNVIRDGLARLGLPVGPWLGEAKRAVRRGAPDDAMISVEPDRAIALGELKREALRVAPGQRLAYVVDAVFSAENARAIVALAERADTLFIETAFLEADAALARERLHLTARQAGELGRRAGAARLVPLHVSPRYLHRPEAPVREAEAAFRGEVEEGPAASTEPIAGVA